MTSVAGDLEISSAILDARGSTDSNKIFDNYHPSLPRFCL